MYGYRACPECGAAVQRARLEAHTHDCIPERLIAHQVLKARRSLERLEDDLARKEHFGGVSARRSDHAKRQRDGGGESGSHVMAYLIAVVPTGLVIRSRPKALAGVTEANAATGKRPGME